MTMRVKPTKRYFKNAKANDMKLHSLVPLGLLVSIALCRAESAATREDGKIVLKPVQVLQPVHRRPGMREGQDLSRIAFQIYSPWGGGPIELRFPEVLRSSAGVHFLDNYSASITPTCEWPEFPAWQADGETGRVHYDFKTPDGLRLMGAARPVKDEVLLEFAIVNDTSNAISRVEANCCLAFNDCRLLNEKWNTDRLFAVVDGRWQPLSHLTPTPEQIGRKPWFLIMREEVAQKTVLPKISATWWRANEFATENLMGAETRDGKHLVGYTWNVEPIGLMSNCGNPCLHTGMGASPEIAAGHSFTWHGKIYFLRNEPEELLRRYRADQAEWKKSSGLENKQMADAN